MCCEISRGGLCNALRGVIAGLGVPRATCSAAGRRWADTTTVAPPGVVGVSCSPSCVIRQGLGVLKRVGGCHCTLPGAPPLTRQRYRDWGLLQKPVVGAR